MRATPPFSPLFRPAPAPGAPAGRSEVLSALSRALDLTGGQPPGHAARTCVIGMRLGMAIGLDEAALSALHYALLLKDAGCSANASRTAALFGTDDRVAKPRLRFVDPRNPLLAAIAAARVAGRGRAPATRVRHFVRLATRGPAIARELVAVRCERGADIARRLGFRDATAEAVRGVDERWDGHGQPEGRRGDAIPVLARIAGLAQAVEAVRYGAGPAEALGMARRRRGRWFDPALVGVVLTWRGDRAWWAALDDPAAVERAVAVGEPAGHVRAVTERGLDDVAAAFAEIIDAKSPYTYAHSANVARYAAGTAAELGFGPDATRGLTRAALLHDVGKLGVSSAILDKAGPLTLAERSVVARHPVYTWQVLSRVGAFAPFAHTAALHHERLDGTGYPWAVGGDALDPAARVLAAADVYEALTADRPYRAGLAPAAALDTINRDRGTRLCGTAIDALAASVARARPDGRVDGRG